MGPNDDRALSESALLARLTEVALASEWPARPVAVTSRQATSGGGTTYRTEVVSVDLDDGSSRQLFVKSGPAVKSGGAFRGGLAGGLAYESHGATVAHGLVGRATPEPLGAWCRGAEMTLVFADAGRRLPEPGPDKPERAVDWLVQLQRASRHAEIAPHVHRFDESFYLQWIDAFLEAAGPVAREVGLPLAAEERRVRDLLQGDAEVLCADEQTFAHGDFYSSNIIETDHGLVVVDWELCSVASRALDLATLMLGWDASRCRSIQARYVTGLGIDDAPLPYVVDAARRHVIVRIVAAFPVPPERSKRRKKLERRLTDFCRLASVVD